MSLTSRRTAMARKRYKPEEIVAKLRQVDVLVSQGQDMADAIRQVGVSEVTYYRWRQEFGGLKIEQVKRLKDLELENNRLRKAVSDLTLDKLLLQEAARGNFSARRVAVPASSRCERSCMFPSAAPVRRSGSIAQRNARSRAVVTTKSVSRPISLSLPGNTAATAIARSPGCCARPAGSSTTSGSSVSGDARGSRFPISSPSAAGSGWRTDRASGCGRSTAITSGPTTLSRTVPTMDAG